MSVAEDHPFDPLNFTRYPIDEMEQRAREYFELMNRRRTVRDLSDEPVPMSVIENMIRTAGTAPSGAHKQPWFFAVITDPAIKRQIREAAEKEEAENYSRRMSDTWLDDLAPLGTDAYKPHIEQAPVLIIVFKQAYRMIDGQRHKNYYVNESVGIAAGMLIAAIHQAGLATLTHTPSPMGFLGDILGRPKEESAILLLPVGYPREDAQVPRLSRKPLTDIMGRY